MKRKEFEKLFATFNENGKQIWVITRVKELPKPILNMALNLTALDFIKFIRFGQHFIEKNGSGILAYISNNSFIDGIIHRKMREELMKIFDKIYFLDLHGNSKKKEICPYVFLIRAINIIIDIKVVN